MSILSKLKTSRTALTGALDQLDIVRAKNADLQADLRRLEAAPLPVAQALEYFDRWGEMISEQAITQLRPEHLLDPGAASRGLGVPNVVTRIDGQPIEAHRIAIEAVFGVLVATTLPTLRTVIEARLDAAVAGKECLTNEERSEKIAAVEAQILDAELLEEGIVRGLELAGLPVERRADASPQAVLASDDSLPG